MPLGVTTIRSLRTPLGVEQRSGVVRLIRKLRSERRSVIVISHDLHDVVLEVAERIVVLRLGRKVAEFNAARWIGFPRRPELIHFE